MKRLGVFVLIGVAATIVTVARGGHELPIYPSFYPHEIEIRTIAPDRAADALRDGKIQAYVGRGPSFWGMRRRRCPRDRVARLFHHGAGQPGLRAHE